MISTYIQTIHCWSVKEEDNTILEHKSKIDLMQGLSVYKFLFALSVRTQLRTAWIMTTRTTRRTRSLLMLELLSRSFCWYKHTSIEWFSFPIRSLIILCSSINGFNASWILLELPLELLLECLLKCFSAKFWIVPPAPALLVSLSWDLCFLFSISRLLFCLRLILDTLSWGGCQMVMLISFRIKSI